MSDHPYVPQNSDTSRQDDLHALQTTAFGRRRMVTALLHGHSRSETEGLRRWPFAVTGVLATGLVAAGLGVANAYQDQRSVDQATEPAAPPLIVQAPDSTVPTTPTITEPSKPPTTPSTPNTKPQTPTTKQPARPKTTPKQTTKNQTTKQQKSPSKQTDTKPKATQSKPKDGSKQR